MVSLNVDYKAYCDRVQDLTDIQSAIQQIPPKYQKLVTENVMLRLFDLFLESIESIAAKLLCGAVYSDGTIPHVIISVAKSKKTAVILMSNHCRAKSRTLHWSKVNEIKENMKYVLNSGDHFITTLDNHSLLIEEMRCVRNRIAHNNEKCRRDYQSVVRRYYGVVANSVTPGTLLLSPRATPPLINQYLAKSRILIKQLVIA